MATPPKLPPDFRKHAITFMSFLAEEKLSTQDNLFEVIQGFPRRFVVDSHIDWLEFSAAPESADAAFILGTTISKEASPLHLLLETKTGAPKIRNNVFMFGLKAPGPKDILAGHRTPFLVITRFDAYATRVLDIQGLRKFDQQGVNGTKWDTSKSIIEEKSRVLALLEANSIEEIGATGEGQAKDSALRLRIDQQRQKCFKDFWKSDEVSRYAHARLLLASRVARTEFARTDYMNVFGDRYLIQNALFLNTGVLSNDKNVRKFARFCSVRCLAHPTQA